jgi:hypothetical protein
MAVQSINDRIARTRRKQAATLSGAGLAPTRALSPEQAISESVAGDPHAPLQMHLDHTTLSREFEALLPAARFAYGYTEEDEAQLRSAVAPDRAGALQELMLIVRDWRLMVVNQNADDRVAEGAARRARIQFRINVMKKDTDENQEPFASGILDWHQEPEVWLIR